jgi:hypothetical protein
MVCVLSWKLVLPALRAAALQNSAIIKQPGKDLYDV